MSKTHNLSSTPLAIIAFSIILWPLGAFIYIFISIDTEAKLIDFHSNNLLRYSVKYYECADVNGLPCGFAVIDADVVAGGLILLIEFVFGLFILGLGLPFLALVAPMSSRPNY
jgi:hypothetical protein